MGRQHCKEQRTDRKSNRRPGSYNLAVANPDIRKKPSRNTLAKTTSPKGFSVKFDGVKTFSKNKFWQKFKSKTTGRVAKLGISEPTEALQRNFAF